MICSIYLAEASAELTSVREKQKQLDNLMDTLETAMLDNDMDRDNDPGD